MSNSLRSASTSSLLTLDRLILLIYYFNSIVLACLPISTHLDFGDIAKAKFLEIYDFDVFQAAHLICGVSHFDRLYFIVNGWLKF
jgi:hypothetical protein